jgi:hypothetical protein
MKRYWIAATVVLWAILPCSSNACIAGPYQSKVQDNPAQQTQSSSPSSVSQASVTTQEPSVVPKTAAKEPAVKSAPAQPSSYVLVELSKTLKASKLKPGDKVKAKVSQDVIAHGRIIVPVNTVFVGHVTEARILDHQGSESRLGIVFDTILRKHFHDINLQAVVQAVAAPAVRRSLVDESSQTLPPSTSGVGRTAISPIGGGSVVGGVISARGQASANASSANQLPSTAEPAAQTSMTARKSPTTIAATGTSAAKQGSSGSPLSVGTPQGVTGIKGLSLSSGPSADTPGPVIISNTGNVKLESGTQILLRVVSAERQNNPAR